ncbi:radical SAM family heme chaperone HemW [Phycisphaerales bacterium AB-hyl4]|uniref:Heme chaperone HemW n=1 Tax=Natronomicrosphaera hydrolytica TaxID=3242702 RepID=A0ABV4U6E7_9BACT
MHVPFCFHKCHYCDFYSIVDQPVGPTDRQARFTDALIAELTHQAEAYNLRPRTIFVGGGTPTLLRPELWRQLLAAMQGLGMLDEVAEFTIEANPETVTAELMSELTAGGVNRISMGAQSFQPRLLKALERWHDPASVGRAAERVQAAGIDNFNLDLIFAIPGQTLDELDADLDAAMAMGPTHLSCYSLIFEPHTPLTKKMQLGLVKPMDEETERAMYERVLERLSAAGFEHYEVSNWARPTRRCEHNLIYWANGDWLGIGPSAASHVAGRRWKNQPHLGKYLAESPRPPVVDEECLPEAQRVGEQLMLGLRLSEGVTLDWLAATLPSDDARWQRIEEHVGHGLLERTSTHLRLTRDGLFVADTLIGTLL